jgi:hypothetical protein
MARVAIVISILRRSKGESLLLDGMLY